MNNDIWLVVDENDEISRFSDFEEVKRHVLHALINIGAQDPTQIEIYSATKVGFKLNLELEMNYDD